MVNRRDRRYLVDPSLLFEENPAVAKAEINRRRHGNGECGRDSFPERLGSREPACQPWNDRDRAGGLPLV